jgi:hypothetical protein
MKENATSNMCHTNDEDDIYYKMFIVEREGIGAPEKAMRKRDGSFIKA